jgi:OmpA-OmpF porin, OOP family
MAAAFRNKLVLQVFLLSTSVLTILASSSPAISDGLYVGLAGGVGQTLDSNISGTGINADADFEIGGVAALSLGYGYENGLRSEIELGGRWSDTDSISNTTASGDVRSLSAMVNALYDVSTETALTPYFGVGLGAANVETSGQSPVGSSSISDDDTALAYQGIVGVSYQISDNVALKADYRYFSTADLDYTTADGTTVSSEYDNHAVLFGISFGFGSSSPDTMPEVSGTLPASNTTAAMPQPEPEIVTASADQTQNALAPAIPSYPTAYRVLFDWNSAALNDKAKTVIRVAAANAMDGKVIQIRASGHADRSGTEKNNLKLSKKRAENVRDALIAEGVTSDYIAIDWFGEVMPVLMTPDNMREVQNRRVEIIFPQ